VPWVRLWVVGNTMPRPWPKHLLHANTENNGNTTPDTSTISSILPPQPASLSK